MNIAERTFVILQYVNNVPSLASWPKCQRKFFTPTAYEGDCIGAELYLLEVRRRPVPPPFVEAAMQSTYITTPSLFREESTMVQCGASFAAFPSWQARAFPRRSLFAEPLSKYTLLASLL